LQQQQESDKIPCVSLFSGIGGLEAGVSWLSPQHKQSSTLQNWPHPCGMFEALIFDPPVPQLEAVSSTKCYPLLFTDRNAETVSRLKFSHVQLPNL